MKNQSYSPIAAAMIVSTLVFKDHLHAAAIVLALYVVYKLYKNDSYSN